MAQGSADRSSSGPFRRVGLEDVWAHRFTDFRETCSSRRGFLSRLARLQHHLCSIRKPLSRRTGRDGLVRSTVALGLGLDRWLWRWCGMKPLIVLSCLVLYDFVVMFAFDLIARVDS